MSTGFSYASPLADYLNQEAEMYGGIAADGPPKLRQKAANNARLCQAGAAVLYGRHTSYSARYQQPGYEMLLTMGDDLLSLASVDELQFINELRNRYAAEA